MYQIIYYIIYYEIWEEVRIVDSSENYSTWAYNPAVPACYKHPKLSPRRVGTEGYVIPVPRPPGEGVS